MAVTFTNRLGLPQWPLGTDVPTRDEFNDAFLTIEQQTAQFIVGLEGARTAFGGGGGFYYSTDTGVLWFFDGTDEASWRSVGRVVAGTFVVRSPGFGVNMLELRDPSSNVLVSFDSAGDLHTQHEDLVPITGGSWAGGSFSHPGYYRSAEGLITVQGGLNVPGGFANIVLSGLPRPRDLSVHQWAIPCISPGPAISGMALANMNGAVAVLTLSGLSGLVCDLDGISYYAER